MSLTNARRTDDNFRTGTPRVVAVDLFCGVGGLTHGLKAAGIPVAAGYDLDPDCEFPYTHNNNVPFHCRDVGKLRASELQGWFDSESYSVLAGCAPCQPFSTYSRTRKGDDERWGLVRAFVNLTKKLRPHIVTMENVPQLINHKVFADAVADLRRANYELWWSVVECADFGVPQTRKRLVLLGSQLGAIALNKPKRLCAHDVRTAIGKLPPLVAGEVCSQDPLHRACILSTTNLTRIRMSKPGGSWRDWRHDLRAECHKRESGSTYPSVYSRMQWDALGPTITTQYFGFGNGRFGHPDQDRAISLREGALLQTFPKTYALEARDEPRSAQRIGRLIGNAVPPALARQIGKSIVAHLARSTR